MRNKHTCGVATRVKDTQARAACSVCGVVCNEQEICTSMVDPLDLPHVVMAREACPHRRAAQQRASEDPNEVFVRAMALAFSFNGFSHP
ncbi:MAG: hypothetical protein WBK28_04075 [Minisyncoccia bacterium]